MSLPSRILVHLRRAWEVVRRVLTALDRGLTYLAAPFGVFVRRPVPRFALLLGAYLVIFLIAIFFTGVVPLLALAIGYVGVLAIGRAWVVNEKQRTAIVKGLQQGDPDALPDLRGTALVSALLLLILFPLLFQQVQAQFDLFRVQEGATLASWAWFALDKTYLKALPDWSALYGVHISSIEVASPWGRHLVLLTRLTFDYLLIQGIIRLLAIRTTVCEAVAVVKSDPDVAVRLGRRAVRPLLRKLNDPEKGVRGGAANALTQLGDVHAIEMLAKTMKR
jgi:hypothetical protein